MGYEFATIDIETTGLNRYKDKITWIGVGLSKSVKGPISRLLIYDASNKDDIRKFKNVMRHVRQEKARTVFQNGKFDTLFLEHHLGIKIPIDEDIMLMGTAYDLVAEHGLKKMAQAYLGVPDWDIKKKDKLGGIRETIVPYLTCDVQYTWELFQYFYANMGTRPMELYRRLLRPAYRAYRDIEHNGLYLDLGSLEDVRRKYNTEETRLLRELNSHYEINWNSSAQVAHVLFDLEGMPILNRTAKGAPSTAADVLKELAMKGYEIPKLLLDYKDVSTRNKMFLNRWEDDCYESRIHPSFNLTNVVSGRTSCNNPNLQQVPRTKDIRRLFSGAPGMILFEADYSQLELRIAAHYAKDKTMLDIYLNDGDIHTETAKLFTNGREPSKEERGKAKAVNQQLAAIKSPQNG